MYPAEPKIKDTSESTTSYQDLLLSIERDGQLYTSINDKRDDFNFHIVNFPFLSSNIPSSPAYCVLFLNLYDTPGLAPRMNVLLLGPCDFPISYSNRDTSWNDWNLHGRYGDLIQQYEVSLSRMLNGHSDPWPTVTWKPIRLSTNLINFIPSLTFTELWVVSVEHLHRCGMPAGNAYPSGHQVPSPFLELACAPIVETRFLELAMSLLDFSHWIPLGSFSILLQRTCITNFDIL